MKSGMELYQLDISENPLCVYQVSDQDAAADHEHGYKQQKLSEDI